MLTTHDMSDVEKLCKRVIVIDHGQVMFDGELDQLKHKYGEERIVNIEFSKPISEVEIPAEFAPFVVEKERNRLTLNADTSKVKPINIVDYFRREVEIVDFEVREPKSKPLSGGCIKIWRHEHEILSETVSEYF